MKQFLSILSLIACCIFVTSSSAVGQANGQTVLDESVLGKLQTADEEFVTKIRHHVLRYFIDVDLTPEQLAEFDEIVTRQTDKLFTIQNRRAELVPADQKAAYQSAVEDARNSGKSKLEAQRAGFRAIGKTDQDQQADQQMSAIRTQAFETMKIQFQETFSAQQKKQFAALTDAYNAADEAGKQAGLPKIIEPSQLEWYKRYKKQQNAPDPLQQLILYETEPALDQSGFQPLFNGTSLDGWVARGGSCTFEVQNGEIVGTCVKGSPSTYLCTTRDDFKDFVFTCEMFWEVDGNTGVMFRAKSKPGKKEDIIYGPQAEMEGFGKKRGWSGGIYGQSCGGYFYPLWCKKHAVVRHALKADAWNRVTISARGNDVKTWVNGIPAAHWVDNGSWPQGFFGLQIHAGGKGTVRFRDLRVLEPAANASTAHETESRIAVMETALKKRADVASFADAKSAGYHAIQMHTGKPAGDKSDKSQQSWGLPIGTDPQILESWQAASDEHGVKIISLCAGCLNRRQIWDKDREISMRIARQTIDACHKLGINVMLFPFFGPSNFQEDDEALDGVAGFMKELLPYAVEKDVVVGIEAPITTVRVMELLERLEFPEHLKVYYDTGNLFDKEDIYDTIRKYGNEHFCEIHIKASKSAIAGQGQIDLAKLAAALDDAQYDGWLVYEANRDGKEPVANLESIQKIVSLRKNAASSPAENSEFRPLFNGTDLTGWDGDPRMWSVKDGVIRGETTDEIRANKNTFLIWDGVVKDFELKLSFRCNAVNNSGIQYRSTRIDARGENKWRVKGYQHEIRNEDKVPNVPGFIYDEGGKRKRICVAGEKAEWNADGKKTIETFLTPEQIKTIVKVDQWNDVRIVARGNRIQHYLNGELFLDFTDNHPELALPEGILALQLHQGKPMWVEFKDVMIRELRQ